MADAMRAAFSKANAAPSNPSETKGTVMVEILFMAQLMRNPLQAIARRWYCRSLYRASRGSRRCAGCTGS
jgi:hypothetical protein